MIIVKIITTIFKVIKSVWNYYTKSIYHFFEVSALATHAIIIYRLWFMLSLKYTFGAESADGEDVVNFIGKESRFESTFHVEDKYFLLKILT